VVGWAKRFCLKAAAHAVILCGYSVKPGKIKKQADFACFKGLYLLSWGTTVIARPAKQAVAISVFDN